MSSNDWKKQYQSYVHTLQTAINNQFQNLPGISDFVASTLSYHDVPVQWLPRIGELFLPGNYTDFIFVHQISRPLTLPILQRIVNTHGALCKLSMCHKYFVLYAPIRCNNKHIENDERMLRNVLPERALSVFCIDSTDTSYKSRITRADQNLSYPDNCNPRVNILLSWFSSQQFDSQSGYIWVMQDIVGWVGDFSQILSLLQLLSTADYLSLDCSSDCLQGRFKSNAECECDLSFVRYSRRLLASMSSCTANDVWDDRESENLSVLRHLQIHDFKVKNLRTLASDIFAIDKGIDWMTFTSFMDDYMSSNDWTDGKDGSRHTMFSPSKPIALVFRNLSDT